MLLIATPTSQSKDYCFLPWIANVKSFSYPHVDAHLVVDNTPGENLKYFKYLQPFVDLVGYQPPGRMPVQHVLAASHNLIRETFLNSKSEWLLHLESDVFPPADVIERLLAHNRPLVAGLYYIGNGPDSYHCTFVWNDQPALDMRQASTKLGSLGFSMANGSLQPVAGAGLGCTLIHRSVLEKVKFRAAIGQFPDTLFWMDAWAQGFQGYCDTSIHCEHRNQDWAVHQNFTPQASPLGHTIALPGDRDFKSIMSVNKS